jgi:hypothetical protein
VVRGRDLAAVTDALSVIIRANIALDTYARTRREQLASL